MSIYIINVAPRHFIGKQLYNLLSDALLCKVSSDLPTQQTIQTEISHQQNVAAQK